MGVKKQLIKITDLLKLKRAHTRAGSGTWYPKCVYLRAGRVVHLRCLSEKRSPLIQSSRSNYSDGGC